MKVIVITESQYGRLFLEQTAYTRHLDRVYSTPEGARRQNQANRELVQAVWGFTKKYKHEIIDVLAIVVLAIPVAGPFISIGLELANAGLYFAEGDELMGGLSALLAVVPGGMIARRALKKSGIIKQIDNVTEWLLKSQKAGKEVSKEALEKKLKKELGEEVVESNAKLIDNYFTEVIPSLTKNSAKQYAKQLQKLISKTEGFWKDFVSNEKVFKKFLKANGDSTYKAYVAYLRSISMKEAFWGSTIYAMLMYFGEDIVTFVIDNNVLNAKDAVVAWKKKRLKDDADAGNISSIVKNDGYSWKETKEMFMVTPYKESKEKNINDNTLLKKAWKAGWRPDDGKYVPKEFRTDKYKEWLESQDGFENFTIMKDLDIDMYDFDPEDVPGLF